MVNKSVTLNSTQDGYKRLKSLFDLSDKSQALMSRIGGEVVEGEDLLDLLDCLKEALGDTLIKYMHILFLGASREKKNEESVARAWELAK